MARKQEKTLEKGGARRKMKKKCQTQGERERWGERKSPKIERGVGPDLTGTDKDS